MGLPLLLCDRTCTYSCCKIEVAKVFSVIAKRDRTNKQPQAQDKLSNNSLADKIGKVAPTKSCGLRVIIASRPDAVAQAN